MSPCFVSIRASVSPFTACFMVTPRSADSSSISARPFTSPSCSAMISGSMPPRFVVAPFGSRSFTPEPNRSSRRCKSSFTGATPSEPRTIATARQPGCAASSVCTSSAVRFHSSFHHFSRWRRIGAIAFTSSVRSASPVAASFRRFRTCVSPAVAPSIASASNLAARSASAISCSVASMRSRTAVISGFNFTRRFFTSL